MGITGARFARDIVSRALEVTIALAWLAILVALDVEEDTQC